MSTSPPIAASLRVRGRPPKSDNQLNEVRQRFLDATKVVFGKKGYFGLTVELVLLEANLTRPTFYRYFRSIEEPLDIVLSAINQDLSAALIKAVIMAPPEQNKLEAALIAWRDWGAGQGELLRSFYTEMHDPKTPAFRHRLSSVNALTDSIGSLIESLGRERPTRYEIDILINCIEYIGLRYHMDTPGNEAAWKQSRDIMMRVGFSFIANEEEWNRALSVMHGLDVQLRPAAIKPEAVAVETEAS